MAKRKNAGAHAQMTIADAMPKAPDATHPLDAITIAQKNLNQILEKSLQNEKAQRKKSWKVINLGQRVIFNHAMVFSMPLAKEVSRHSS